MKSRWVSDLGNVSSTALEQGWSIFVQTLNDAQQGPTQSAWHLLPLPTGTGKTQGLALYCSLLPKDNHPGVLIVTNLVAQATGLANLINELSGDPDLAFALHSGNRRDAGAMISKYPVLIITHAAFTQSWDNPYREIQHLHWVRGERKLTVIDEALDAFEHYEVSRYDLGIVRGLVNKTVASLYAGETAALDFAIAFCDEATDSNSIIQFGKSTDKLDFNKYGEAITEIVSQKFGSADVRVFVDKTLHGLQNVLSDWAIRDGTMDAVSLTGARFLLPASFRSAVVLDATALESGIYKILGERAVAVKLPDGMKNYKNVTFNISYDHAVGKQHLSVQDASHFHGVVNEMKRTVTGKTLVCVHKIIEPHFVDAGRDFSVGHWYALTGLNQWRDCSNVFVYGLPHLNPITARNALISFLFWNGHTDVEQVIKTAQKYTGDYIIRHVGVFVVQAVNRAHCRMTIDDKGNCPKTQVYICLGAEGTSLGDKSRSKKLLGVIQRLMPSITIAGWVPKFTLDDTAPTVKRKSAQKLIDYFKVCPEGTYDVVWLQDHLGMTSSTMEKQIRVIKGNNSLFASTLADSNVRYEASRGPGSRRAFIKTRS